MYSIFLPNADNTIISRYVRNWQVARPTVLPYGEEVSAGPFPKTDVHWTAIRTERRGLVNLSRIFGPNTSRKLVWMRTTVQYWALPYSISSSCSPQVLPN